MFLVMEASQDIKSKLASLYAYMKKRLGIKQSPALKLSNNIINAKKPFGLTGNYDHANKTIRVYTTNRHLTDILRSLAHEIVHHWQNENGQLPTSHEEQHYAQKDNHLRKKEMEAYLLGNILFRDWQDEQRYGAPDKEPYLMSLNENLMITNPTKLKDLMKNMIRQMIANKIITSYHRDLTSGDTSAENFEEEFAHELANALERQIDTINNRGNWENQPSMVA